MCFVFCPLFFYFHFHILIQFPNSRDCLLMRDLFLTRTSSRTRDVHWWLVLWPSGVRPFAWSLRLALRLSATQSQLKVRDLSCFVCI